MSRTHRSGGDRNQRPERRTADVAVAGLLAAAGGLHLAALPSHLGSAAVVGAFFAVTAFAQLIGAILVATRPSRRVAAAVVVGNLVFLGLWALSRTTGLPVGGDIGAPEPLAALDGLAALVEILVVVGALGSLVAGRVAAPAVRFAGWQPVLAVGVLWMLSGGVGTSLAGSGQHHHSHDHGATADGPSSPILVNAPAGPTDLVPPAPAAAAPVFAPPDADGHSHPEQGDHPHSH